MDIAIRFDRTETGGNIILPASKSISNRVLIINALADSLQPVRNLSDCDDTVAMLNVLNSNGSCFDIGHAGTAMRFLTAYLSRIVGKWEITGSARMKERPVAVLVDALNRLGANIEYKRKRGISSFDYPGGLFTGRGDRNPGFGEQPIYIGIDDDCSLYGQRLEIEIKGACGVSYLYSHDGCYHAAVWGGSRSRGKHG